MGFSVGEKDSLGFGWVNGYVIGFGPEVEGVKGFLGSGECFLWDDVRGEEGKVICV